MKITHPGYDLNMRFYGKCTNCGCEFQCNEEEALLRVSDTNKRLWTIQCPNCTVLVPLQDTE